MNDPRQQEGDVLAQLAEAFAGQTVPPGPDDALKQRLIVALERQSNRSTADGSVHPRRKWTMRKTMGVAALLLVMVAIGGFVGSRPGSPGAAFAAMIDHIKEIRSVRFVMRSEDKESNSPITLDATITSMFPWTRYEVTVAGQKVIATTNSDQHKTLMLFESDKAFMPTDEKVGPAGPAQNSLVEKLRSFDTARAEYVGKEQIDGIETMKYRCEREGDFYTLWIDPIDKLPIRLLTMDTADASAATMVVSFSKFEWNVPIEPGFFTLEPPAGYTLSPNAAK